MCTWELLEEKWWPEDVVRTESLYIFLTKSSTFVGKWQDEKQGFMFLGGLNCGKWLEYMGEIDGRFISVGLFVLIHFDIDSQSPVIGVSSRYREGTILMGNFYDPLSSRKGEVRVFPATVVSQVSSAQNNQHAKVAYFGMTCSFPLISMWLLMDIWVISSFELLCVKLLWIFMYKCLCGHVFISFG